VTHAPGTVHTVDSVDADKRAGWVMQLVVHVPRDRAVHHTDVCIAAAQAVVALLDDPRAQLGGDWRHAVDAWHDGRIRKHARRARGAAWDALADLDGVDAHHCTATVRAFVPTPLDAVARPIAKLQLHGLDLADPDATSRANTAAFGTSAATPPDPATTPAPRCVHTGHDASPAVHIVLSPAPALSTGKAAAAAGHAAQLCYLAMDAEQRRRWRASGYALTVTVGNVDTWNADCDTAEVRVVDAGFTDVAPGTTTATATVCGCGPTSAPDLR
jgi:peptidyl-tRNA hydrolase